jgi:hypothetical protein
MNTKQTDRVYLNKSPFHIIYKEDDKFYWQKINGSTERIHKQCCVTCIHSEVNKSYDNDTLPKTEADIQRCISCEINTDKLSLVEEYEYEKELWKGNDDYYYNFKTMSNWEEVKPT